MRKVLVGIALAGSLAWVRGARERSYYEVIIRAEPFGAIAEDVVAVEVAEPAVDPVRVQEESNKIQLCAMTETPDGRTAVGLIDNGVEPPAYITLFDGEEVNGLALLLSDLDGEYATFQRDGITFTLGLGLGLLETITPELLAARAEAAEAEAEAEAERERRKPNSLAEQLLAMQLSFPPDIEPPPLPIPIIDDPEEFTRKFDEEKEESEARTESEALIKAGLAEMKASMAAGERPEEYLQRLVEHQSAEVKRQQEEKQAAKEALDETLAEGNYSEAEVETLQRRANIELMKKGVVPLTPVTDLTEAEQAEIQAALEAMP